MGKEYLRKEHLIHYPELKNTFLFEAGHLKGFHEGMGYAVRALLEKEYSVVEVAQMLNLPLILVENFIEGEKRLSD